MKASNTTIQNRSKQARLHSEHVVPTHHLDSPELRPFVGSFCDFTGPKENILYSIGCALLEGNQNPAVLRFLADYDYDLVLIPPVPNGAFDLLGSVYQYLNSKKENLEKGSFYTGRPIAHDFVSDLNFSDGQVILDPACGSGAFLFHSSAAPKQVFGIDFDPIAIMIAKFNYFIKFPDADDPNLYCADFFDWFNENHGERFDYIIGNPPYGANLDRSRIPSLYIQSGESFSYFIELSFQLLSETGRLRFLVPDSLLNVKRHTDVRDFMLDHTNLTKIKRYSSKFAGVMSDIYMVELDRGEGENTVFESEVETLIPKSVFRGLKNQVFVELNSRDIAIIERVNAISHHDLSDSTFGLGVVTGDNKTKLFSDPFGGSEPIYTGKEVEKFRLVPPRNYLLFDRSQLQQVAPDEIYRAPEKLVYQTISKYLKFALDTSGSLTTNSANIVIPRIPGYDIRSVLALLNSDLYSYLYIKLFGGVNKIGKEHLMALPFPDLSLELDIQLTQLAICAIEQSDDRLTNAFVMNEIFNLSQTEIEYIELFVEKKP